LLVQLLAAFPLGLATAAVFAWLIAKPIRQLDRAIRQLGGADLARSIRVEGPADLQFLGERLEWLRHRLTEAEEQKARFLRHISHELKTPLTALREGSELLADGTAGALAPQQREVVAILQANSVQLARMIDDLLNYQRAVAGVGELELTAVDLGEVAADVVDRHKLAAAGRSVSFDLRRDGAKVLGDRDKLRIVLDNLVSNAVKFSPAGGIVQVAVTKGEDTAVIDVSDQGPGIAPADRDKVFEWFFQSERPQAGRVKGSGLGLAIAREFVLAHGGRIELVGAPVEGEAGQWAGTRFKVTLPPGGPRDRVGL
jgi:two-component system sensor histidine kinase GlrK